MKDFPRLQPNKAIFGSLSRLWNKAETIAVVNSFSSMCLEINSVLAAKASTTVAAQPEVSTKTKDKRDL